MLLMNQSNINIPFLDRARRPHVPHEPDLPRTPRLPHVAGPPPGNHLSVQARVPFGYARVGTEPMHAFGEVHGRACRALNL